MKNKVQTFKTLSPQQAAVYCGFCPLGSGLPTYSFWTSSSGTSGSNHSSIQQAGWYSGKRNKPQILVVGIGQTLRSDDGIGIKAVQAWKNSFTAFIDQNGVEVWLRSEFSIEDLQRSADFDHLFLIDAMISGSEPGTVRIFSPDNLSPTSTAGQSAHGWSLIENLELAKTLNLSIPKAITLIGVEAKTFDMGENLSPEVEISIPEIVQTLQNNIGTLFQ